MPAENQKRDSQGRFKKKMFKAPDLSSPTAPKVAIPSQPKKQNPISKLLKPKKEVVIPIYNPVEEAAKMETALDKPKGLFGKKKQEKARKEVEGKFGLIDWNPESKFEEITPDELETTMIQSLGGPTPINDLRRMSGSQGKVFKIKNDGDIVKIAELALLTFVEAEESLELESENEFRNIEHVVVSIEDYDVRLTVNEVIFIQKK